MPSEVPPVIDLPKSVIGVGTREMLVLGITLVIAFAVFLIPADAVVRIFLAVLVGGLGIAAAFGRDPKTGKTVELYVLSLMNFYGRARFAQRGAMSAQEAEASPVRVVVAPSAPVAPVAQVQSPAAVDVDRPQWPGQRVPHDGDEGGWFQIAPLPLGGSLLFQVLGYAFLAAMIFWIWGGGAEEFTMFFNPWR